MKTLFLQGYGLSIKVQNTRLVFKQGITDPFSRKKPEVLELPATSANFDKIVIQGKGYVSTEALERLAEANINVIMLDKRGKLYSYFHQIGGYEPLIRQKQYDCFRDEQRVEYLRKWIVSEKIQSQIRFFEELAVEPDDDQYTRLSTVGFVRIPFKVRERIRRSLAGMRMHYSKLEAVHTLREIIKIESDAAKLYYPTFVHAFNKELGFNSRNNRRTYRPTDASDVINGLLNYGFSILYAEVAKQLNALGLDCAIGFYHTNKDSRLALVYDMIEPFRHIVDRSVLEIQNHIRKKTLYFQDKESSSCLMN